MSPREQQQWRQETTEQENESKLCEEYAHDVSGQQEDADANQHNEEHAQGQRPADEIGEQEPRKFDPAKAASLDSPEREACLPTQAIVALFALSGQETVVDYGSGTGRLSVALADALPDGRVLAVDEGEEMVGHLRPAPTRLTTRRRPKITAKRLPKRQGAGRLRAPRSR